MRTLVAASQDGPRERRRGERAATDMVRPPWAGSGRDHRGSRARARWRGQRGGEAKRAGRGSARAGIWPLRASFPPRCDARGTGPHGARPAPGPGPDARRQTARGGAPAETRAEGACLPASLPASGRGGTRESQPHRTLGARVGARGRARARARGARPRAAMGDARWRFARGGEDGAEARGSKSAPSPSHARLPTLPRVCARGGAAVRERGEPLMVGPRSQYSRGSRPTPRRASPRPAWARADIILYRRAGARPTRGPRARSPVGRGLAAPCSEQRVLLLRERGNGRGRPSLLCKAQAAADSPSRGGLLRHRVAARHNRQRRARRRPP